jgi:hypothetical protein
MGRSAVELTVTAQDRRQLESFARSQSLPAALPRRAPMILRLADGESNSAVARRYRVSRPTVSVWRKRFAEHGIAGLHNERKSGRPRRVGKKQIAMLINTALTRKPRGKTHWSRRSLADQTALSKRLAARRPRGAVPRAPARFGPVRAAALVCAACRRARAWSASVRTRSMSSSLNGPFTPEIAASFMPCFSPSR